VVDGEDRGRIAATAMNAPWPSEICPVKPVRMFSPAMATK
jgi:hypothetical protein